MSLYSKTLSEKKELARNQLLSLVEPTVAETSYKWGNRYVNCLSLPSDNFEFEKKLRSVSRFYQIDTVEHDRDLYQAGLPKAQELGINHYCDNVFDFLAKSDKRYHIIWLDLCGYLTPNLMTHLIPVFQGKYTAKKALIGLTTMQQRENLLIKEKKHYGFHKISSFRIDFPKYLDYFADHAGCKLTHHRSFKYISANGRPMKLQKIIIEQPT